MRAGSLSEGLSPGPVSYWPMEHGVERKGGPWRTAQSDEPSPRIMNGARRQVMPSRRAPDEPRHAGRRVFARCPRSKRGASHGGGTYAHPQRYLPDAHLALPIVTRGRKRPRNVTPPGDGLAQVALYTADRPPLWLSQGVSEVIGLNGGQGLTVRVLYLARSSRCE